MTTHASTSETKVYHAHTHLFERVAGVCALLSAAMGLLYGVSFFFLRNSMLNGLFLMLVSLLSLPVLTAIYRRVADSDAGFALLSFLLVSVGAFGALIHGAYDLANVLHPPTGSVSADFPNAVDPRGLLTFGVTGLGILLFSWLIGYSRRFKGGIHYVGYLAGILLLILYLGRLIILTPTNPVIAITALLSGFLVNPLWYVWLGIALLRSSPTQQ
jgi:hypothetical protein